jgi:hypothetical protein
VTGTLTFIGTATTLIEYGGFHAARPNPTSCTAASGPTSARAVFSTRQTEPALQVDELPPLDVVVLSHLHDDHFDRIARDGLPKTTPIVTTAAAARTLRRWGLLAGRGPDDLADARAALAGRRRPAHLGRPGPARAGPLQALLPPVNGHVLEHRPVDGRGPDHLHHRRHPAHRRAAAGPRPAPRPRPRPVAPRRHPHPGHPRLGCS